MIEEQVQLQKGLEVLHEAMALLPDLRVDKAALKESVEKLFAKIKQENEARVPKLNFPKMQYEVSLALVEKFRGLESVEAEKSEVSADTESVDASAKKEKKSKGKS